MGEEDRITVTCQWGDYLPGKPQDNNLKSHYTNNEKYISVLVEYQLIKISNFSILVIIMEAIFFFQICHNNEKHLIAKTKLEMSCLSLVV